MTPESDNFDQLKRLLTLKRHEVPPPGYFNNFSRDVISRIRAGDTAAAPAGLSWVQRLWQTLEMRPAFAGAFSLGICMFLVGGILYTSKMEDQAAVPNFANNNFPTLPITASTTSIAGSPVNLTPGMDPMNSLSGTPQSGDSLFNPLLNTAPVSFRPFGNGN